MAFERGEVDKEYLALVRGEVAEPAGEITVPIGPAEGSRVHTRLAPTPDGKPSHTAWRVERRLPSHTLLRVFPKTGRRHQIRVHLEALGHPVVGDLLYGRSDEDFLDLVHGVRDARRDEGGPLRHLLHCARLVFPDPNGPGRISVDAELPPDFVAGLDD
jgi:23S rRNA pseudouridine1911/1915/1917 synthase